MDTDYREHGLPPNQPLISTSDMKRLMKQINEWRGTFESFPASLGLAVGAPGVGKTIAVHRYLRSNEAEQRSRCAFVKVMPSPTLRSILASIFRQFGMPSRGRSSYDMASELQEVSQQGKPPLLVLDDSDYFLDRTGCLSPLLYDILSLLVKHTSCFVLLIAPPKILTSIEAVPQLDCRIGLSHHFGPMPDTEMYEVFLPQLVIPGWEFHVTNEEDLRVGKYLWENARPSLRRVRMLLDYASYLAQISGSPKITFEHISLAVRSI